MIVPPPPRTSRAFAQNTYCPSTAIPIGDFCPLAMTNGVDGTVASFRTRSTFPLPNSVTYTYGSPAHSLGVEGEVLQIASSRGASSPAASVTGVPPPFATLSTEPVLALAPVFVQ